MITWTAADAKRRFAKVLKDSAIEPQILLLRGKPTGVVVSYESYMKNQKANGEKSLAQWLRDLSDLHETEGDLDIPPRLDRAEQFGKDWE
jgi:prevent-host-death family protein